MKKVLKWVGIILGLLLLCLAAAVLYLNSAAKSRLEKKYDVPAKTVAIPSDSTSIAAGKQWTDVLCRGCHGANLAGTKFFDVPALGLICTPNITPGGVAKNYTDLDWDRALRHGVGVGGRPLLIMPSENFKYMSDEHIGQVIAYLKTVAPVEQTWEPRRTTLYSNLLIQLGVFGGLNAETIDHKSPSHSAPKRGATAEYGNYIVRINGCRVCHGEQLNGGKPPEPDAPLGPNLTPGGSLAQWDEPGFIKAMQTGITPFGKELNATFMPWKEIAGYNEDQLKAVYAYLKSLPKLDMAEIK